MLRVFRTVELLILQAGRRQLDVKVEAEALAEELARRRILVRSFDYDPVWLRFGLPGDESSFERLGEALAEIVGLDQ